MSNIGGAVIEAVADAMYPYWTANGGDVRAALLRVKENHPSRLVREQAWASFQFVTDWEFGADAYGSAMRQRQIHEQSSAG